jgi:hypothetical protein
MEQKYVLSPMEHRAQVALCLDTGHGAGCGHPVDWHVGRRTPAPDCGCCSRRKSVAPRPEPVRTPPPPGFPEEKWTMMNRRERRAAMKGRRK